MTALTLITEGEVIEAVDASSLLYAAGLTSLADAPIEQCAEVKEKLSTLKSLTGEADGLLDERIVHLQDQDVRWTTHVGPYTIKSSSPTAGSVTYDEEKLREALAGLVTAGVISAAGANAAVECIQPTAAVPYGLLRELGRVLIGEADQPEVEWLSDRIIDLLAAEPNPTYKVKQAGVNALLKIPAAREAVEACQIVSEPGRRKAKVTRA